MFELESRLECVQTSRAAVPVQDHVLCASVVWLVPAHGADHTRLDSFRRCCKLKHFSSKDLPTVTELLDNATRKQHFSGESSRTRPRWRTVRDLRNNSCTKDVLQRKCWNTVTAQDA